MSDDDFTTLRLLQHDLPPEAVDASLDRARVRFETAARGTTVRTGGPAPARTAPPVRWMRRSRPALLTGAALLVAGGLVATGVGVTHWGSPESAAAATLHEAAAAAAADRTPTAAFTKVVESELSMVYATSDGEHYGEGYLEPTTTTTWVPADVSGTWVRETRSGKPTTFFGGAAAREAASDDGAGKQSAPVRERGVSGDFAVGELGGEQTGTLGASDIADLPRDPHVLIGRIEAAPRAAGTTDELHVFDTISGLLRTGLVPRTSVRRCTKRWRHCPTSSSPRNRSRSTADAALRSVSRAGAGPSSTTSSSTQPTERTSANGVSRPGGSAASPPARRSTRSPCG